MRKTQADWVRHDTNASEDEKLMEIALEFGDFGIGFFWRIIEFLARQPSYCYSTTLLPAAVMPRQCGSIATIMRVERSRVEESRGEESISELLYAAFYKTKLLISKSGSTYSESLNERMRERDRQAEANRKKAERRWAKQSIEDLLGNVSIPPGINTEDVRLWLTFKAEKRQSYKESGLQALLNKWAKMPERFASAVQFSMANNYQGLFEEKRNGTSGKATTNEINAGIIADIQAHDRARKAG